MNKQTKSPTARSENMRRIKSRNTAPELRVRSIILGFGYHYRLHAKDLPGKPDIIFRSAKKAIFVHGCFWHLHSKCKEGRIPHSNTSYWAPKLLRNVERDQQHIRALRKLGWKVLVIWECESESSVQKLASRLARFLGS